MSKALLRQVIRIHRVVVPCEIVAGRTAMADGALVVGRDLVVLISCEVPRWEHPRIVAGVVSRAARAAASNDNADARVSPLAPRATSHRN